MPFDRVDDEAPPRRRGREEDKPDLSELEPFGRVLLPGQSEPPILGRDQRAAVHQWMTELQCADDLRAVGLAPRMTALFAGPPGCGKTTLAHHIAARLGVPMLTVEMPAVISQYVGESGRNIYKLFRTVRGFGHGLVLFLDELDAVVTKRGGIGGTGAGREFNNIVIAFLQMIDSHVDQGGGMIVAATNRGEMIDPAIWRRFALHLDIAEPTAEERFAIIRRYLTPYALADEGIDILVQATKGATPALLRQLMEAVKRDLVLSPRFNRDPSATAVFARAIATVQPPPDTTPPPLWSESTTASARLAIMPWPPTRAPAP